MGAHMCSLKTGTLPRWVAHSLRCPSGCVVEREATVDQLKGRRMLFGVTATCSKPPSLKYCRCRSNSMLLIICVQIVKTTGNRMPENVSPQDMSCKDGRARMDCL